MQHLLNGSETWTAKKRVRRKLRAVEGLWFCSMVRRPQLPSDASMKDKCSAHSRAVREAKKCVSDYCPLDKLWMRKWTAWMGHIIRMDFWRWAHKGACCTAQFSGLDKSNESHKESDIWVTEETTGLDHFLGPKEAKQPIGGKEA